MIIKVRTPGDVTGWRFFEADEVAVHYLTEEEFKKSTEVCDTWRRFDMATEHPSPAIGDQVCCISFHEKNGTTIEVCTYGNAYLLNDKGQTIEKLN